jgi:uncharacterized protein YndB with AHSA1/START domain
MANKLPAGVIEIERRIAAPPETVFSFFTDADLYRQWQGVDAELDPRPGGIFRVTMTGRTGVTTTGVYLEVEAPRRIVYTWGWEPGDDLLDGQKEVPPGSSTVEMNLEADGDGTLLRLRHSGLPTETACLFHNWGWDVTLNQLIVAAEGGELGPNPFLEF